MAKRIHLICNAHIDPTWQWEWEEGAAEALSTFRSAADFCEDFEDFVFNHNEVSLYRWILEYEPELFERIKEQITKKKWHVMGGWYLQPDCNMPSGESFVRQMLVGRHYFKDNFGAYPTTAINFDPFGHTRGLVQIMKKAGFDSYIFCRPDQEDCNLPAEKFLWKGYDGSEVVGVRVTSFYNSALGRAADKIKQASQACPEDGIDICLWGVGNHGGGASRGDLERIGELKEEMARQGVELIHSTPEDFLRELDKESLPVHAGDLNLWAPGCYTSQIRVKQKYRKLENSLFFAEKIASHAAALGRMEYPRRELEEACYSMLTAQFHDTLPGTSVQPVEESGLRGMDYALELLARVRARAFFALSEGQKKPEKDEIPILIYNPHPCEIEGDWECEFMLWDQNWNQEFSMPVAYCDGEKLPTQCEKELSNIPLDWRKRVVFHAKLQPMSMNRFNCKMKVLDRKPIIDVQPVGDCFVFDNGRQHVEIGTKTGLIEKLCVDGISMLKPGACKLCVFDDFEDPWSMHVHAWTNQIGEFQLLCAEEGTKLSALKEVIPSVRVVEDGEVRTVVEAVFGYEKSNAVVRYLIPKQGVQMDVNVRVVWTEKQKMLKMCIPADMTKMECLGEVAFGQEKLPEGGRENCSQRYLILKEQEKAVALINDGVYGSSYVGTNLYQTLLRSAAYTAHPIKERQILPGDRYSVHMEQGERLYNFKLDFGRAEELLTRVPKEAAVVNQQPFALSFFPSGKGEKPVAGVSIIGEGVELMALKKAEKKESYIARVYNGTDSPKTAEIADFYGNRTKLTLSAFEVCTLQLSFEGISPCDMMEFEL